MPLIGHPYRHAFVVDLFQRYPDIQPGGRVLHRVIEQVPDGSLQLVGIAEDDGRAAAGPVRRS